MITRELTAISLTVLMMTVTATRVRAQTVTLAPVRTAVLPSVEGDDTTRVAFVFDLSGLRAGPGRRIDKALLVWRVSSISPDSTVEFSVRPITQRWDSSSLSSSSTTAPPVGPESSTTWAATPKDAARGHAGTVVLNVLPLVRSWAIDTRENYGIVVSTPDLPPAQVEPFLPAARLSIWYGFMK